MNGSEQISISSRSLEQPRIAENIAENIDEEPVEKYATTYSDYLINYVKDVEKFRNTAYKLDGETYWTIRLSVTTESM